MPGSVKKKTTRKKSRAKAKVSERRVSAIFLALLYIFVALSIGVIGYTIYYFKNNPPTTIAVGEVDSLTYSEDKQYPIEVLYSSNAKQNGERVYELRMNYYIDPELPSSTAGLTSNEVLSQTFKQTYSSGIQFVDKIQFESRTTHVGGLFEASYLTTYTPANAYYYNTTNNVSYDAIQELDYKDKWIIDFGEGRLGRITQDAENQVVKKLNLATYYSNQNINKFLLDVYYCVESLEYGKQVLLFDLSDYFTFEYFSTDDLKFHVPDTDEQHLYVNILVDKTENGMVNHEQSLFDIVANNANWTYDGVIAEDYWTSHAVLNLTIADFELKDSKLSLNEDAIDYYSSFDPKNLDLTINIDLTDSTATGFAEDAFGKLQVDEIVVTSSTAKTFSYYTLPENCTIIANNNVTLEVIA